MSERNDMPPIRLVASSADASSATRPPQRGGAESRSYIRLVPSPPEPPRPEAIRSMPAVDREAGGAQLSFPNLFDTRSSLLAFLDMSRASGEAFTTMLRELRPPWLLDLRPLPRFDYGRLNRRVAFRLFSENQVSYHDIACSLQIQERHDARLHAGILSQELSALLASWSPTLIGPIVILVDDPTVLLTAKKVLPGTLEPRPRGGWIPRTVILHQEHYSLE